jgi:PAS domain S-box-containing protein
MFDKSDRLNLENRLNTVVDFSSKLSNPDSDVWEMIFESLPDMVALIDLNNLIVKANKAMLLKLNVGEKGIVGNSCHDLMHDKGCAISNCPHLKVIKDNKPHSIEIFEPKFGCYLNFTTTPIFDSENNLLGSLHIARDISHQKESEEKLRQLNNELSELNKSKDKFFSLVAHDLRSPFQGMLGFTDLILEELDTLTKAEIKDYLQKVRDSSYGTFMLLENLLHWSRLQSGRLKFNPSKFNLREASVGIVDLLKSNAQNKNVVIINNINSDFIVNADQQMMHSILLNLTTNAIKFSEPGGKITLNSKIKMMCEDNSENKGDSQNQFCLEISIADTGVGMSAEVQEKLFKSDEIYTQPGTYNEQGVGLGLKLAKEMTEIHGGKLTIKSEEGKGSEFSFIIPLVDE